MVSPECAKLSSYKYCGTPFNKGLQTFFHVFTFHHSGHFLENRLFDRKFALFIVDKRGVASLCARKSLDRWNGGYDVRKLLEIR
jgi:hypothetical protein